MNKLITKLQEILTEKGKLKATDIVKGNTIFGINGSLDEIKENAMISGGKFSKNSPYHAVIINDSKDNLVRKNGSIQLSDEEISSHIGLTADKIKSGNTILGLEGTVVDLTEGTSDATAVANDLVEGKTAYVNGQLITGTVMEVADHTTKSCIDMNKTTYHDWENGARTLELSVNKECLHRVESVISVPITNDDMTINLVENMGVTPDKVLEGQSIMGVNGTAKGYIDPATTEDYATCISIINDILGVDEDPGHTDFTENNSQP